MKKTKIEKLNFKVEMASLDGFCELVGGRNLPLVVSKCNLSNVGM